MRINGFDFKIGADPEVFVKRFGGLVSAYGLVPGTKEAPWPLKDGAVQVDGMALEFNINPADDYNSFERNMTSVLSQMINMVPGYEIFVEPVAEFGHAYINAQPKVARDLGCNPDFNAYTGKANPRPDVDTPFRTASGHIHIGWHTDPVDVNDPTHLEACHALVKTLDVYLGLPSLTWDRDTRRRQLYGKAGAFRPKSYGLEYRTLSNKWINDPVRRQLVYENTISAINRTFENPAFGDTLFEGVSAREIIDNWDGKPSPNNDNKYEIGLISAFNEYSIKTPRDYRKKPE